MSVREFKRLLFASFLLLCGAAQVQKWEVKHKLDLLFSKYLTASIQQIWIKMPFYKEKRRLDCSMKNLSVAVLMLTWTFEKYRKFDFALLSLFVSLRDSFSQWTVNWPHRKAMITSLAKGSVRHVYTQIKEICWQANTKATSKSIAEKRKCLFEPPNKETLPKAQQTRGLRSYRNFLHKS